MIDLNHQESGFRGVIAYIGGDKILKRKLMSLGLRHGQEITVLQRRNNGVVVSINGSRIALGASVAAQIFFEPATVPVDAEACEAAGR